MVNQAAGVLPEFDATNFGTEFRLQSGDGVGTQAIIPDYMFACCGNVTSWGASVRPGGGGNNRQYDIAFQVWRPSPTVDGCYSLVGQDLFTSIEITVDNLLGGLVPTRTLQVSSGDVVGVSVSALSGLPNGIQLHPSVSASFWFATGTEADPVNDECPLPVGAGQSLSILRTDAPIITVAVGESVADTLLYKVEPL